MDKSFLEEQKKSLTERKEQILRELKHDGVKNPNAEDEYDDEDYEDAEELAEEAEELADDALDEL